jgi:CubicO group peptidase (beta-lactamase class C family)
MAICRKNIRAIIPPRIWLKHRRAHAKIAIFLLLLRIFVLVRRFLHAIYHFPKYILLIVLAASVGMPAQAQEDYDEFFDDILPRAMRKADVPGAAVVLVRDGAVVFARGYGYADIQRRIPVSPDSTLFRVASLSKVVTATAVMQLVEQGRVDLDADVSRYLDFPIPPAFDKPITMRHLMTHTAGFDDTVGGRWIAGSQPQALRDYLTQWMPKRIYAPGAVPAYSSYGSTLAGYVVERVSGEPFNEYVERHIFAPLHMRHSTFAQPLPQHLSGLLTKAYNTGSGPTRGFDTAQIGPATSMSATPMDMGRFILSQLGGATNGSTILKPSTLKAMHAVQYRHHPAGPGIVLGLIETDLGSQRAIAHVGDIPGYHSGMYLWPEQCTGLFVVQNSEAGYSLRDTVVRQFTEKFLGPHRLPVAPPDSPDLEAEQIEGSYLNSQRFHNSPLFLNALVTQRVVRRSGPGKIVIDGYLGPDGKPVLWRHIDSGLWQNTADARQQRYFRQVADGNWEMSDNRDPHRIAQASPWYLHKWVVLPVLSASLAIVLLSLLAWPVGAWLRRRIDAKASATAAHRMAPTLAIGAALTVLPWAVYGGVGVVVMGDILFVSTTACANLLRSVQGLAWISVAASLVVAWRVAGTWRLPGASWATRMHGALIVLAMLSANGVAALGGLLIWDGQY